jgi:hypothetical protein
VTVTTPLHGRRPGLPAALGLALLALLAAAVGLSRGAHAVSSGQYDPARQGCSGRANAWQTPSRSEPRCHNAIVVVSDGAGHDYLSVGTLQTAQGQPVHSADYQIGRPAPPRRGLAVYFGVDDNVNLGEHDGDRQWPTGPSDGGALAVAASPDRVSGWAERIASGDRRYFLTHPLPASAGGGFCVDGPCVSVQSQRTEVFQGGARRSRDAADYSGKAWDPYDCSSQPGMDGPSACGGHTLRWWNQHGDGTVYAEPGVQVYQDPDAKTSPNTPFYPVPAVYAGTCGVTAGGGAVAGHALAAPASPVTNRAGQVQVKTGC